MDYERLASELLRALRGRRSQAAFARRLGYRSNMVYLWESGRCYPTAAKFFRAARRTGIDLDAALRRFFRRSPAWLEGADLARPVHVARLLDDLRGRTSISDLAERTGKSRFAVARWLRAETQPRLPDFLRLLEATSLRLLDFIAVLADPAQLASIANDWRELENARRAAYELPWTQAVLCALELSSYAALPRHEPGWIAQRIGCSQADETGCLALLAESGQIRMHAGRWTLQRILTVDTRKEPDAARALRAFWAGVGLSRLERGVDGTFAYNVFGVSEQDLTRIRELQIAYFRELRAIVASSQPVQRVVLANVQLMTLDG